jgi:hypothetical protein
MKWIQGLCGAALIGVAMGITGCYTVIMVPRNAENYDNDRWAQEESVADTTTQNQKDGQVVNNFYIYDDWAGHWSFDPFWTSPYHWRYSSWWGGAFYDPFWDPWPYYGYYGSFGGWPYGGYRYGMYGSLDWYAPGYYDPYWVYMDGYYGPGRDEKRRPFDRRESTHVRDGLGGSGFSAVNGSSSGGISRLGKAGETTPELGMGTRRIPRTAADGMAKSSGSGISTSSSDRRIRRTDSAESRGSTIKAARGSSGAAPATTRSGSSERRERRGSSSGTGSAPSNSGSSGSSGGSWGGSSSGSSGSSGRSSSPPSSSGGSSSGSSGHRTRR